MNICVWFIHLMETAKKVQLGQGLSVRPLPLSLDQRGALAEAYAASQLVQHANLWFYTDTGDTEDLSKSHIQHIKHLLT